MFSDGVTEAKSVQDAQFGMDRLQQAIRDANGWSARGLVEHVVERVARFTRGADQSDDITCVAVVRKT